MTVNSSSLPERIISILASSWVRLVTFRLLIDIIWSPAFKPFTYASVFGLTLEEKEKWKVIRTFLFTYLPVELIMERENHYHLKRIHTKKTKNKNLFYIEPWRRKPHGRSFVWRTRRITIEEFISVINISAIVDIKNSWSFFALIYAYTTSMFHISIY